MNRRDLFRTLRGAPLVVAGVMITPKPEEPRVLGMPALICSGCGWKMYVMPAKNHDAAIAHCTNKRCAAYDRMKMVSLVEVYSKEIQRVDS